MAVDTTEGGGWACLDNGVGNGAIGGIDSDTGAIGPGGIMAGAATAGSMTGLDGSPGLDLTSVATVGATPCTSRDVTGRVVAQPMGNFG